MARAFDDDDYTVLILTKQEVRELAGILFDATEDPAEAVLYGILEALAPTDGDTPEGLA